MPLIANQEPPRARSTGSAVLTALGLLLPRALADVVPTDGMVITQNTTFVPGVYALPSGVSIGASGVTLDMNGAELVGTNFNNFGVTCIGRSDVTIRNGRLRGYYYGARLESGVRVQLLDCDLSDNWLDPASRTPQAPFLNINAGPNLFDRTNLGGGIFARSLTDATIAGNTARNNENGLDLYGSSGCGILSNDFSDNTGWGIHLYASSGNLIQANTADRCTRPGLGDSAGVLLVYGSSNNQLVGNSFQYGGDGFFIGNEWGCPSNNNFVQGNNGSFAGANAFEATFSAGNQFIANIASHSNYGFWLGYSHNGNVIRGNLIRGNNANGIEIEHGQNNAIEDNEITFNGGAGVVLRTDNQVHLPPDQFPCLNLPNQAASSGYTIRGNRIHSNFGLGVSLTNTTASTIVNNLIGGPLAGTAVSNGAGNTWSIAPTPGPNIVGGPTLGGNWWFNYAGQDTNGDGLGDTGVPYTNGGQIAAPGDPHPLIGNPDLGEISNPRALCGRSWRDLGRNRRANSQVFNTSNGTHFATDGATLLLLESADSARLSRFNPATTRYEPLAAAPEIVTDGGDFQFGGGRYFATMGVIFDKTTGAGNGSHLCAYDAATNTWATRAATVIAGHPVCNEALAFDPAGNRLYATIMNVKNPANGGDLTLLRKLAIYDPATNAWTGVTAAAPADFAPGSEAEYLDGRVYVWPGGGGVGGAVSGSDSFLYVYDIATNTWSTTPTLQSSGVIPGFRSGALDVWGVALASDPLRRRVFVLGGEGNRLVYVFDVAAQRWGVTRAAPYDGGWGDGLEYVAGADRPYLIDGRNAASAPQGTAALVPLAGDADGDCTVGQADLDLALFNYGSAVAPGTRGDVDCDGRVGQDDLDTILYASGRACP